MHHYLYPPKMIGIAEGEVIETTNAQIRIVGDEILHVCYNPDTLLDVADFKEPLAVLEKLSESNTASLPG